MKRAHDMDKYYSGTGTRVYKQPRKVGFQSVGKGAFKQTRRKSSQETGYVDLNNNTYACDTTGSITLVATIAQGTTINQRVGKKAFYKSHQIRGSCRAGTTGTIADLAVLIVYDKRPTGALPAITDILISSDSNSFNNDVNSNRFSILMRKNLVTTGNRTTPATGLEAQNFDFFLKNRKPIIFKAAGTGAIADIEEGAIYLITVGNVAAGTTAPDVQIGIRTRFTEQ